ncbi:hypothetical protein AB0O86_33790 [Streptomyces hirsutus]|uniref:hypothetical protein n=1 Tax=Streptomyces hirsutus TaxID=35620 RepID=UPI003427D48F
MSRAGLGQPIVPSTIREIPPAAGPGPAPRRAGPSRRAFLTTRAERIIAADFFHVDTITGRRLHAPAFLEHGTLRLHITGITAHPTAQWATRQARHPAAGLGARVESLRLVFRDRKYPDSFDAVFAAPKPWTCCPARPRRRTGTHTASE